MELPRSKCYAAKSNNYNAACKTKFVCETCAP